MKYMSKQPPLTPEEVFIIMFIGLNVSLLVMTVLAFMGVK